MTERSTRDAATPRQFWVGTSGWQYADWKERLYPDRLPQRHWLEHYATEFTTVEVNATFYRLPSQDVVRRWAEATPADFTIAVKASRYLSHIKRLREPAEPVARLLDRIVPLRESGKLGPVLLQLPPDMPAELQRLDQTLALMPASVRVAVEFRHRSWYTADTRDILSRHGAALVWTDRGGRSTGPLWQTTSWCYLRLHHGRHDWAYDAADLRRWARRARAVGAGYVYANNDPGGAAVSGARRIRELIA